MKLNGIGEMVLKKKSSGNNGGSDDTVLRLSDDIGKMADRIGDMADRIGDPFQHWNVKLMVLVPTVSTNGYTQ